jgi:hypothetical protein
MIIMHIAPHLAKGSSADEALCPKVAPWPVRYGPWSVRYGKYLFSSMSYYRVIGAAGSCLPEMTRAKGN